MKKLLLLALCASSAFGAWSSAISSACLNGPSVTSTTSTAGADLIVVVQAYNGGTPGTLSDLVGGQSNTWNVATAGTLTQKIYYSIPTHTGALHVFTITGGDNSTSICFTSFSGSAQTSALGGSNCGAFAGAGTTTLACSASYTPSIGNVLLISGVQTNYNSASLQTQPSGWTFAAGIGGDGGAHMGGGIAYLVQASPAAVTPSWTGAAASAWMDVEGVYFLPPSASTVITRRFIGMGR